MAETEYEYTISSAFPSAAVNPTKLKLQVDNSAIVEPLSYINTDEDTDNCEVWFDNALTGGDQTVLDGIVAAHDGQPFANRLKVQQVTAIDSPQTTSLSDILVPDMAITPGPGNYMITFTSSTENSANSKTNYFSIYKGSSQLTFTERRLRRGSSQGDVAVEVSIEVYVEDINMDEAIEIRWRTDGGTATVHARNLVAELRSEGEV